MSPTFWKKYEAFLRPQSTASLPGSPLCSGDLGLVPESFPKKPAGLPRGPVPQAEPHPQVRGTWNCPTPRPKFKLVRKHHISNLLDIQAPWEGAPFTSKLSIEIEIEMQWQFNAHHHLFRKCSTRSYSPQGNFPSCLSSLNLCSHSSSAT